MKNILRNDVRTKKYVIFPDMRREEGINKKENETHFLVKWGRGEGGGYQLVQSSL